MFAVARRVLSLALVSLLCFGAARVEAVSVRDIIELARAGLSDDVLLALIETDKTVFTLSTEQLIDLKQAGVSDRVVIAMLEQGRKPPKIVEPSPVTETMTFREPEPRPAPVTERRTWSDYDYDRRRPSNPYTPAPASQSTTVVVVPTPVYYPYPIYVPQRSIRPVHCEPGRIIGRTEKLTTPVPGRWVANGRTGSPVFMSDPVCQ